jgi:hypothetical protein
MLLEENNFIPHFHHSVNTKPSTNGCHVKIVKKRAWRVCVRVRPNWRVEDGGRYMTLFIIFLLTYQKKKKRYER